MKIKRKRKKGLLNTFDSIGKPNTEKHPKDWEKNHPAGCRKKQHQVEMQYTCIVRAWSHENKMFVQRYVCPLGVKGYGKELLEGDGIAKKFAKRRKRCIVCG